MRLSEASLDFAIDHISNFYDSDFFVKPFEFMAIRALWGDLKKYILTHEIEKLETKPPLSFAAPKHTYGFRIVHQLDPLNTLVYTALAWEVGGLIEKNRIPIEEKVACSYRINIDGSGSFFSKGNGYDDFQEKSYELANKNSHVLVTDIADFYNQIYLHRLKNNIENCNSNLQPISSEIENFIMRLNNGVSKGIPVGPAASIIFAEASLMDIDQFIQEKGFSFTRYVDDYRIFSSSEKELMSLLEKLSHYIYSNHRMSLASSKVSFLSTSEFVENYLNLPEELEKRKIHEALEELNLKVNSSYPSVEPFDLSDLDPEDKIKIQAQTLVSLLQEIIDLKRLDLGLARHILRRSGKLRTRSIYKQILRNFDFFAPVVRDVIIYFERVSNSKVIDHFKDEFVEMLHNSKMKHVSYVGYWLRHFFSQYPEFNTTKVTKNFISESNDVRIQALCAMRNKTISWIREHKDQLSSFGAWERRAVMYSSLALSRDERYNWMNQVESSSDNYLEKMLARYLKSYK